MTGAYINHLSIAYGSLMELETQIQIASRLSFVQDDRAAALLKQMDEISRMLTGLRKSLAEIQE